VVQADLADNEASRLAVGQDALVLVDGIDARLEGVITSISNRDGGLGKIATLSINWAENRVAYGVPAQVGFTSAMRGDALLVPEKAVRSNGARNYVEYMEGPSRRAVDVQTGIVAGGMVEIVSGLQEGQTVLVRP
jgi:multidrug efflux pump subunit AcrA (membrane-fusion protein)